MSDAAGNDRVDPRHGRQVFVGELAVGVRGKRRGERFELVGPDREPGGGAVAAEALEVGGAGGEAGVQVEGRHRPARALPAVALARDQHDRAPEALDEAGGDDADHALVPALAPDDVGAVAPLLRPPGVDRGDGFAEDPLLDGLPVAVERLELVREEVGLAIVLGQHQVQRNVGRPSRPAALSRGASRNATAVASTVAGIDARDPHQRPQSRLLRAGEPAQADRGESTVLVDQRYDVGDRGERDEIGVTRDRGMVGSEERLRELDDHARAAEIRERVVGRPGCDDRAARQRLSRPVVVGDDHVDDRAVVPRRPPRRR